MNVVQKLQYIVIVLNISAFTYFFFTCIQITVPVFFTCSAAWAVMVINWNCWGKKMYANCAVLIALPVVGLNVKYVKWVFPLPYARVGCFHGFTWHLKYYCLCAFVFVQGSPGLPGEPGPKGEIGAPVSPREPPIAGESNIYCTHTVKSVIIRLNSACPGFSIRMSISISVHLLPLAWV